MAIKKGGISQQDREFIISNMNNMSVEDIAAKIQRHPGVVDKIIKTYVSLPDADNQSVRWHLKKSLHWKHLKEEFTENELGKIEEQYVKYVSQFREDITATEEVQILNLIKIEILMDRNLKGKMKISSSISRYESMVSALLEPHDGNFGALSESERDTVMNLEDKKSACLHAESARTTELMQLQKEHNTLMEKVKGSRDQRVTEILNNKVSFQGLVKELLDRDKQEKDSRMLELSKMAMNKEMKRLAQPHIYMDNIPDNPILCADVVKLLDEQNNETETQI